uniref:GSCFA domain-containing protein n=1 Tax=Tenacibaculum halocynthiae TaxID=1254437 RepID=UPI003D6537AE
IMNLQTQIPLKPHQYNQLDYQSEVVLFGSCFSENIANKLTYYKFKTLQNLFGILFYPKGIETLGNNAINQKEYTEKD